MQKAVQVHSQFGVASVLADEIFGGIKAKWPQIRTVATLDWEVFPADLPLNVWVDEYADYGSSPDYRTPTAKEKLRQSWLASGADSTPKWSEAIDPTRMARCGSWGPGYATLFGGCVGTT